MILEIKVYSYAVQLFETWIDMKYFPRIKMTALPTLDKPTLERNFQTYADVSNHFYGLWSHIGGL